MYSWINIYQWQSSNSEWPWSSPFQFKSKTSVNASQHLIVIFLDRHKHSCASRSVTSSFQATFQWTSQCLIMFCPKPVIQNQLQCWSKASNSSLQLPVTTFQTTTWVNTPADHLAAQILTTHSIGIHSFGIHTAHTRAPLWRFHLQSACVTAPMLSPITPNSAINIAWQIFCIKCISEHQVHWHDTASSC